MVFSSSIHLAWYCNRSCYLHRTTISCWWYYSKSFKFNASVCFFVYLHTFNTECKVCWYVILSHLRINCFINAVTVLHVFGITICLILSCFLSYLYLVKYKILVHKLVGKTAPTGADKGISTMLDDPKSQKFLRGLGVDTNELNEAKKMWWLKRIRMYRSYDDDIVAVQYRHHFRWISLNYQTYYQFWLNGISTSNYNHRISVLSIILLLALLTRIDLMQKYFNILNFVLMFLMW